MSAPVILVCTFLWLVLAMAGAWALQRRTGNAGWVDVVWSAATGIGAAFCALLPAAGTTVSARDVAIAGLALLWSGRLAWHIAERTRRGPEDIRYAGFRRDWGADFDRRLAGLLLVQAFVAFVLDLAVLVAARRPGSGFGPAFWLAIAVLAAAIAGEAVADAQLRRYRHDHPGGVCDAGLWSLSRHPNFVAEVLGWCAYPILAIVPGAYPEGLLSLGAPVLMFGLLRYVSGVPMLEQAMQRSRGEAFRAYQARVPVFFPTPFRRGGRPIVVETPKP